MRSNAAVQPTPDSPARVLATTIRSAAEGANLAAAVAVASTSKAPQSVKEIMCNLPVIRRILSQIVFRTAFCTEDSVEEVFVPEAWENLGFYDHVRARSHMSRGLY